MGGHAATRFPRDWAVPLACVALAGSLRLTDLGLVRFMADEENLFSTTRRLVLGGVLPVFGADIGPGLLHWGHLGPLVYYLLAIPYTLSSDITWNLVAFVGFTLLAVALTWRLGREFFGPFAAGTACLLHAVSPYPWFIARELKDPSFLPPFVCLFFLALLLSVRDRRGSMVVVATGALACVAQFHVTAYLYAPVLLVAILVVRPRLRWLAAGAILGLFLFSPYLVGQVHEGFADLSKPLRAMGNENVPKGGAHFAWKPLGMAFQTSWRNFHEPNTETRLQRGVGCLEMAMIFAGLVVALWRVALWGSRRVDGKEGWPAAICVVWLLLIPLSLGMQGQEVYARHLIPLYPVQFLLVGLAADRIVALGVRASRRGPSVWSKAAAALVVLLVSVFAAAQVDAIRRYKDAVRATGLIADGIALGEKLEIVSTLVGENGICPEDASRIHCPDTPEHNQGFRYLLEVAAPNCPVSRPDSHRKEFAVFTGERFENLPRHASPGVVLRRARTYALTVYDPLLVSGSLHLDDGSVRGAVEIEPGRAIRTTASRLVLTGQLRSAAELGLAEMVLYTNACPEKVSVGGTVLYSHDCEAHFRDNPWEAVYRFDLRGAREGGVLTVELRNVDSEVKLDVYDVQM